jgi:sigma-E factor negative regulatory protein RseC
MTHLVDSIERGGEVVGFDQGQAQVRLEGAGGCNSCGSRGTCASGSKAAQVINLSLPAHTRLGDRVTVSMPASSLTLAAMLGYLLPPVCLLVGAILSTTCFEGDAAAVLGAGSGLVAGLLLVRLMSGFAFGKALSSSVCPSNFQPGDHP